MTRPKITDIVYLKTGDDKEAKIITGVLRRYRSVQYELTSGVINSWHNVIEFGTEKPTGKFPTIKGLKR